MLKYLFVLLLSVSFVSAAWVFVNDDGTFSSYGNEENSYVIPHQEIEEKNVFKVPEKKKKISKKIVLPVDYEKHDKTIYLTFDDGPLAGSKNIIETLVEEGVPATMFMVGKHIEGSASRRRIYQWALDEPLILVANHTYTHANGRYRHFYSSEKRVLKDLKKMDVMLSRDDSAYGIRYTRLAGRNVFRLPEMHYDDLAIKSKYNESGKYDALYAEGFYIYGWDYQWSYNPRGGRVNKTAKTIAKNIESIYKRGRTKRANKLILLMHDFSFQDRHQGKKNLGKLITILRKNGWKFETLETYL